MATTPADVLAQASGNGASGSHTAITMNGIMQSGSQSSGAAPGGPSGSAAPNAIDFALGGSSSGGTDPSANANAAGAAAGAGATAGGADGVNNFLDIGADFDFASLGNLGENFDFDQYLSGYDGGDDGTDGLVNL